MLREVNYFTIIIAIPRRLACHASFESNATVLALATVGALVGFV
jgi:hypothetical protein